MDERICVSALLPEEIVDSLKLSPAFRGKQIFQWISRGAENFSEMTNLSASLREELSNKAVVYSTKIEKTLLDPDGTIKLQVKLRDGSMVETVLLTDKEGRKTACVSCQVGCAMKCAFCMTGTLGLSRNLDASEIIEQFFHLERIIRQRSSDKDDSLSNIVFMGMGEPMQNLGAIRKAVEVLTHKDGRSLSSRRITLSTSGIISGIYDMADNGPYLRLAVSLTTADEELRKKLMPVTIGNPLNELKKAIKYYAEKTGRRVTLEAALLSGKNTGEESAKNLVDFARNLDVNVNLIPWNPVENLDFESPSSSECKKFVAMLEKAGLNVTLRTRRGQKIGGACGQLGEVAASPQVNS